MLHWGGATPLICRFIYAYWHRWVLLYVFIVSRVWMHSSLFSGVYKDCLPASFITMDALPLGWERFPSLLVMSGRHGVNGYLRVASNSPNGCPSKMDVSLCLVPRLNFSNWIDTIGEGDTEVWLSYTLACTLESQGSRMCQRDSLWEGSQPHLASLTLPCDVTNKQTNNIHVHIARTI